MLVKIIFSSKTLLEIFGFKVSFPSDRIRNKEKLKQHFLISQLMT